MPSAIGLAHAEVLLSPAVAFFAVTLFLLSADLLFFKVAGVKIKYGYFAILALWLFAPGRMLEAARAGLSAIPPWAALVLLPLAISVASSANVRDSLLWCGWLAFDLFTILTVYAFLVARRFPIGVVQASIAGSVALIALFGLVQFVSLFALDHVIFEPQRHFDTWRINGVSGWPHFLNIFSFLLLPMLLLRERISWAVRVAVVLLLIVLVHSTAKTGWVLFVALGVMIFALRRALFVRHYLRFLIPVTALVLLIPTPSMTPGVVAPSTSEKVARFAADLNLEDKSTSGTDRVMISRMGLNVWSRHPWFGVGPRAYDDYVFSRFDSELPGVNKFDANHNVNAKNENIWIEWLAENGALFTLGFLALLVHALWVRRWSFANPLHLGAWMALVLYFAVSGQVSQNGLLTLAYAVFGIYFYARGMGSDSGPLTRMRHVDSEPHS
ncbi:MAG: O-antigen ligase family protein [Betaproteobacteria bacterium]